MLKKVGISNQSKDLVIEVGANAVGQILADKSEAMLAKLDVVAKNPILGKVIQVAVGVYAASKSGKSSLRSVGVGFAARPIKKFVDENIFKSGAVSDEVFDEVFEDIEDDIEDEVFGTDDGQIYVSDEMEY